jgi:hypothetical protein
MADRLESESPANTVLRLLDLVARKLDLAAARQADQVVVVRVAENVLEASVFAVVGNAPDEAAFDEQRQVAVERRLREAPALEAKGDEQVVHREVVVGAEDFANDRAAIARQAQPARGKKASERFERFGFGLGFGDHGNSFLQLVSISNNKHLSHPPRPASRQIDVKKTALAKARRRKG